MSAFSKLPQRVIVKNDGRVDFIAPKNVLLYEIIPQQEILAHPKTRLFFTHCGMKGVFEAAYFKVPMVGMPIFLDQHAICARMADKGLGKVIDMYSSEDELISAITEVLEVPK